MRLTGLTLPILLGALLLQVVTAEKPGVCPECLNPCSENLKMVCDSDGNCNGTQKCCQVGCVYSCTDPVVIKPGECPRYPTPVTACPSVIPMKDRNCTGDQDCNGTQKCCQDGCGYSCKNPAVIKPGLCPPCPNPYVENIMLECDSDDNCNGTQRCCLEGCVFSCTDPEETEPGDCPEPQTPCLGPPTGPVCFGDQDCDGLQKCCKDGSQFSCKDPVALKDRLIPISLETFSGNSEPGNSEPKRKIDQINWNMILCWDNCHTFCEDRAGLPRVLPISNRTCPPVSPGEECRFYGECEGGIKCCLDNCYEFCNDPEE